MSDRRKWSEEEQSACLEQFYNNISLGTLPGKSKILNVIEKVPALKNRTWIQVKNFLRNTIKKIKKTFPFDILSIFSNEVSMMIGPLHLFY